MLRYQRSVLVRAPHVTLWHLRRLDDRLAAHLDGLAVAGQFGARCAEAALERAGTGEVFAAAVGVIEAKDMSGLDTLLELAATLPEAMRGLVSAFGWVSASQLQGSVRMLLASPEPHRRAAGLAACRMHRVDPGSVLSAAMADGQAMLRSEASRTAAQLGRTDQLGPALAGLGQGDAHGGREAALAACLLGDRAAAVRQLEALMLAEGTEDRAATLLVLLAGRWERAAELVRQIAQRSSQPQRRVIRACGWLGDTRLVPWLIELMAIEPLARLAGESFTMITGADLAALELEREPPRDFQSGPTEDPLDDDVAMDEDDSLPWPDTARVSAWWGEHRGSFPVGTRCLMGAAPTLAHCEHVLREGTQRQRAVAAVQRCVLRPGTVLFPIAAPAWRQRRLLGFGAAR